MIRGWIVAGALAALAASHGASFVWGYSSGRQAIVERLKDDRIKILLDGKEIDDEVLGADDDALCVLLGGCELRDQPGGD